MQREISNSVFLGQNTSPLIMWGCHQPLTEQLQAILIQEKKFKKLENLSELEPMMLTLRDTLPVSSSWYFRAWLRTLILKKNLQAHPTKAWNN